MLNPEHFSRKYPVYDFKKLSATSNVYIYLINSSKFIELRMLSSV